MAGKLSRRLAETIEKLAALHGTRSSEDGHVHLRVAQHDLASILRVGRQSVNKELAALAASGVIKLKYNTIVVLDPVALQNIARPALAPHATDAVARVNWGQNSLEDVAFMERALRTRQAFAPWSFTTMTRLLRSSRVGRHPRGSVVWTDLGGVSEYILFVSGHTSVGRVSPEGDRFSLLLWGPGDFTYIKPVREEALPAFRHGHYDYVATTDVVAIHMPMALLLEILDSEPMLWKEALLMSERQHVSYTHTVQGQVAGSLQQRVAFTVQRLAALHGTRAKGDGVVRLQVSQASLAMMLQANRQAVNKELKALAAAGAIGLEYNAMTVLNPEALRHIATLPE
ncbi:Crp/Fnr family transcriptional regulator [Variovorax sp. GB1P17]|uniref:Crp/Fnr family transcriptional regulator n=1 Tax=Variovorax sp. GB1P17 TaxID=3443740 RepID=UPI003F46AA25